MSSEDIVHHHHHNIPINWYFNKHNSSVSLFEPVINWNLSLEWRKATFGEKPADDLLWMPGLWKSRRTQFIHIPASQLLSKTPQLFWIQFSSHFLLSRSTSVRFCIFCGSSVPPKFFSCQSSFGDTQRQRRRRQRRQQQWRRLQRRRRRRRQWQRRRHNDPSTN